MRDRARRPFRRSCFATYVFYESTRAAVRSGPEPFGTEPFLPDPFSSSNRAEQGCSSSLVRFTKTLIWSRKIPASRNTAGVQAFLCSLKRSFRFVKYVPRAIWIFHFLAHSAADVLLSTYFTNHRGGSSEAVRSLSELPPSLTRKIRTSRNMALSSLRPFRGRCSSRCVFYESQRGFVRSGPEPFGIDHFFDS